MRSLHGLAGWFRFCSLLALTACSSALDLGHDRAPASVEGPALCAGLPCFRGSVVELGTSYGSAKGLVVDDYYVYWAATKAAAIMVTPRDGGASNTISTTEGGPFRLADDSLHIYFTSDSGGYVASVVKPPTPSPHPIDYAAKVSVLVSGEPQPESIVAGSEGLYFADEVVGTLKRTGFAPSPAETIATGIRSDCELALDPTSLFYTDAGRGEIHAIDRTTGVDSLLLSGREHLAAPLPRGEVLYFLEGGSEAAGYQDGRLLRMPRAGGSVEVLLENLDSPAGIAADSEAVYLCTRGTALNGYRGRILRRADDGRLTTLATDQAQPFAIAATDQAVYWTADAENALRAIWK